MLFPHMLLNGGEGSLLLLAVEGLANCGHHEAGEEIVRISIGEGVAAPLGIIGTIGVGGLDTNCRYPTDVGGVFSAPRGYPAGVGGVFSAPRGKTFGRTA